MLIVDPRKATIRQNGSELRVVKQNVWLTRGDSGYISFDLVNGDGSAMELTANDVLRCQVRVEPNGGELICEGVCEKDVDGSMMWHIQHDDTADVAPGTYAWDCQLECENGDIFTIIPLSDFHILDESTEVTG